MQTSKGAGFLMDRWRHFHRPTRVDENQSRIIEALRKYGASVHSLATVGSGCPDLLVGFQQRTYLLEIKRPMGPRGGGNKLTEQQKEWLAAWRGGNVWTVHSADEAIAVISAHIRNAPLHPGRPGGG